MPYITNFSNIYLVLMILLTRVFRWSLGMAPRRLNDLVKAARFIPWTRELMPSVSWLKHHAVTCQLLYKHQDTTKMIDRFY